LNYHSKVINRIVFYELKYKNRFILNRKGPKINFVSGEVPWVDFETMQGVSWKSAEAWMLG
jgi:hypothetical protein